MTTPVLNARLVQEIVSSQHPSIKKVNPTMTLVGRIAEQLDCPDPNYEHDRAFISRFSSNPEGLLDQFREDRIQYAICNALIGLGSETLEAVLTDVYNTPFRRKPGSKAES